MPASAIPLPTYPDPPLPMHSSTRDISIRGITELGTIDNPIVHTPPFNQHHLSSVGRLADTPGCPVNESIDKDEYMPFYAGNGDPIPLPSDITPPANAS